MYRKHLRLKEFDYSSSNWYFVTICTKNREKLFVPKVDPRFQVNNEPDVAAASYAANHTNIFIQCLNDLSQKYYDNLEIDFYCVMPDHIHLIIGFQGNITRMGAIGSRSYNLGDIVRTLKATTSRDTGKSLWQPNYYEHVIRNETSLDKIRRYILNNLVVEHQEIPWERIDSTE